MVDVEMVEVTSFRRREGVRCSSKAKRIQLQ
jgi:hypothetical protein